MSKQLFDYIRYACYEKGLSLNELSKETHLTYQTLMNLKVRKPHKSTLDVLADFLELDRKKLSMLARADKKERMKNE